ncbi:hypothetical protein GSB9_03199 [Flavobacteriaceae bacterium GSB9]|nr:hypothetical protein GSB9_03199 [Flavobacteriaceae bacterium GSB9]
MKFEPEYFRGMLKVFTLTLLITMLSFNFTNNPIIIILFSILVFLIILILNNKKWIKKVIIDFETKKITVKYPLNLIGVKKADIPFDKIKVVTYYDYMYRTPAHFKIEYFGKTLRFNCNKITSKKICSIFENNGIKTIFYNNNNVGFR